jgi:hypothetical protein
MLSVIKSNMFNLLTYNLTVLVSSVKSSLNNDIQALALLEPELSNLSIEK